MRGKVAGNMREERGKDFSCERERESQKKRKEKKLIHMCKINKKKNINK